MLSCTMQILHFVQLYKYKYHVMQQGASTYTIIKC